MGCNDRPIFQPTWKSPRPDGSLHGESWLFHMDAAFEDTQRQGGELMWKGRKDVIKLALEW